MATRTSVLVTRRLPDTVERELRERFDVTLTPADVAPGREALRRALTHYDGVLCTVTDRIDADVLAAEPLRTRIIANFGVGFEHIDVAAAARRGIVVTNTPGVLTDDTADLAMTLLLMAARRAGEGERLVRAGEWSGWAPTHHLGTRVTGKTLGIVGFGRIGRAVAQRARDGFGMRVLVTTRRSPDPDDASRLEVRPLRDLLASADFVSLHVPSTPETRHMIDGEALRAMQPHAVLINTARGDIVDEAALANALRARRIAAAGLDVYEHEPQVHPALLELDNVVLLPHLGSATVEAREAMGRRALANLKAFFAGEAAPDRVA
ncbi:MAG: D-glycerate dehydrogenase [Gemmatimonadota bacterium]|nr:D-glycerate dehydrogenase [Gemmatimonadota bacterium]